MSTPMSDKEFAALVERISGPAATATDYTALYADRRLMLEELAALRAESYIEPTEIVNGRNNKGEDCIVVAHMPGAHRVDWLREVQPAPIPKRASGRRDAESARQWADAVTEWARTLREAADWADEHAANLTGPDGAQP